MNGVYIAMVGAALAALFAGCGSAIGVGVRLPQESQAKIQASSVKYCFCSFFRVRRVSTDLS